MSSPCVVVLGNTKGGTGKSTVAMHMIISLIRDGYRVASIDLDAKQGTLSRYINNRKVKLQNNPSLDLPNPTHIEIFPSENVNSLEAQAEERAALAKALFDLKDNSYIVIDTPGSDNHLSRLGHSFADILITPLNDSFIDLDLLVHLNDEMTVITPSHYAEMVWNQKKEKALRSKTRIEWIVLRNRTSSTQSKNKAEMEKILLSLSKRFGFRYISGFGDRVIFRELFLSGLTLLDLRENNFFLNLSHITAKQELTKLLEVIFSINGKSAPDTKNDLKSDNFNLSKDDFHSEKMNPFKGLNENITLPETLKGKNVRRTFKEKLKDLIGK
jgi:chromosome partitioning protein